MKFEIVKNKIKEVVVLSEKIAAKNNTLHILSTILLIVKKQELIIRSTNLEIGVEFTLPIKSKEEGSVAVSGLILLNTIQNLYNSENIYFESKNNNLLISTNHNEVLIKSVPSEEFPTIPFVLDGEKFSIKTNDLVVGIKSVINSASLSDIKPELSSVYIHKNDGVIVFTSTDSVKLTEKISKTKVDLLKDIILPSKTAIELIRIFEERSGDIDVIFNKNQITFLHENVKITSRIINSVYPDYKQIIPKKHTTEVIVLKQDIINTLKGSQVFSDKFNKVNILINPENNIFEIKTKNPDTGESITTVDATISGSLIDININHKYLIDVIQSIPQDSISISFNGGTKPIVIKGVGDNSLLSLVMPMNK